MRAKRISYEVEGTLYFLYSSVALQGFYLDAP
jgi:hypothetical protein